LFPKITRTHNFFPIEDDDGQNSRKLNNNVEAFSKIGDRDMEKVLGDDEVTGAGNREKFGEAFDKRENNGLDICHKLLYDEGDVVFKEEEKGGVGVGKRRSQRIGTYWSDQNIVKK